MKLFFRISLLLIYFLIAGIRPAVGFVHPVSHTDAWVKVSKTIDVRLNIFLDDVLRHQGCLPETDSPVPRKVVEDAIAAHGQLLLKQLRIFQDQSRPLLGKVTSEPEWKSQGKSVDLSIDSSLKLTWKLSYAFEEPVSFDQLLFLHDFTHESLDQTGELRLHLQDTASGRRIDAVIPARQPYTIFLPKAGSDEVADTEIVNQLAARIVIGPTHVMVELSAPVLLMDVALPQVRGLKQDLAFDVDEFDGPVWDTEKQQQAELVLQDWANENLRAEINGDVVVAAGSVVEFFPMTPQALVESDAKSTVESDSVPLIGTAVGIRLSYVRGISLSSVSIQLQESPGLFSEANISVSSFSERYSILQTLNVDQPAESCLAFEWLPTESPQVSQSTAAFSDSKFLLVLSSRSYPGFAATLLMAICACVMVGYRLLTRGRNLGRMAVVSVVCVGMVAMLFPDEKYDADADAISQMMNRNLSEVYFALQQTDEQQSVNLLSEVLVDDVLEDVYLNALNSLNAADDQPLATIRKIAVERCVARKIEDRQSLIAECQWSIDAMVEHWGHSHVRRLQYQGDVGLVFQGDRWKIRSFRATAVPLSVVPFDSVVPD